METITRRPKLNAKWHKEHPMPKKATMEQRVAWHKEHAKVCACHPIPASVLSVIEQNEQERKERFRKINN
jgi:hypothetical protein